MRSYLEKQVWDMLESLGYNLEEDNDTSETAQVCIDNMMEFIDKSEPRECRYTLIGEDPEHYEMECGPATIDKQEYDDLCPDFCPFCGDHIIENNDG